MNRVPSALEPRLAPTSEWFEREAVSHLTDAGHVAQAGAGALLLAVGVVEFLLGVWAAGWWQRSALSLLVAAGVAALVHALPALARRPPSSDSLRRADAYVVRPTYGRPVLRQLSTADVPRRSLVGGA